MDLHDIRREVFALHGQGRFADALAVVAGASPDSPAQDARLTFWRACLLARLDRPDEALTALLDGAARELWWFPDALERDEDLAPVRALPAFSEVLETSRRRLGAAQSDTAPALDVVRPEAVASPPLLLALHMRGGSSADTLPRWRSATDAGVMVAALQSSQPAGMDSFCWDDREQAEQEVADVYRTLERNHPFDPEHLVLGGASQGAALALSLALRGLLTPPRGVVVVAGAPDPDAVAPYLEGAAGRAMKCLFVSGEHDPARPRAEAAHRLLESAGVPSRIEVVAGLGHDYPDDFDARLEGALGWILGGGDAAGAAS